jgi:hypothetical protein
VFKLIRWIILPTPILEKNPLLIFPTASTAFIVIVEIAAKLLVFREKSPAGGSAPDTLERM